jgi:hypothetical protein
LVQADGHAFIDHKIEKLICFILRAGDPADVGGFAELNVIVDKGEKLRVLGVRGGGHQEVK